MIDKLDHIIKIIAMVRVQLPMVWCKYYREIKWPTLSSDQNTQTDRYKYVPGAPGGASLVKQIILGDAGPRPLRLLTATWIV